MSIEHYMWRRRVINNAIERGKELRREEELKKEYIEHARREHARRERRFQIEAEYEEDEANADFTPTPLDEFDF